MDDALIEMSAVVKKLDKFEVNFRKCSKANRTKGYLTGRLLGLGELWKNICDLDTKIESLKDDKNKNDSYFEDNLFDDREEKYYSLRGEIEDQLTALNPTPQVNTNQRQQQPPVIPMDQSKVKLPKITLPTFAGSYHTWMSFKNRFSKLIHESKALSDLEKLEYLNSCVTGQAETAIQRFQITDENYKLAWERLNKKYDNKRILQDTQIETIIDKGAIKVESAREIRELLDVMDESLEALQNLEVDTTTWDPMLVVLMRRKLPFKTREAWEKEIKPNDVPTYKQLIDFLEQRYRAVESLELVGEKETSQMNQVRIQKPTNKPNQHGTQSKCIVCHNERHSLVICEQFLNMSQSNRSAFVNAKSLCRNCLAVNHTIDECRSNNRCLKCSGSHHTLLHKEDLSRNESQEPNYKSQNFFSNGQSKYNQRERSHYHQSRQSYPNQSNYGLNPNANPYTSNVNQRQNYQSSYNSQTDQISQSSQVEENPQVKRNLTIIKGQAKISSGYSEKSKGETLFPTAMVPVRDEEGRIWYLRALLDQCSDDEAFIKESTVEKLRLKQFAIPEFEVSGMEEVVTAKVNRAAKFEMIINNKESMEIEASVVQNLVGILPRTELKYPMDSFKNLKLADPTFASPDKIDIMLGGRIYANLLLDGVIKERGYVAQNTKLGWIISGSDENSQPKKSVFCGCTRSNRRVNGTWSHLSNKKNQQNHRNVRSYQNFSQQNRYQPIFRNSHNVKPIEPKFSSSNQLNEYQSNNREVKGASQDLSTSSQPSSKNQILKSTTHSFVGSPRPSLIDFDINQNKSKQISRIVANFAQRWKTESLLATTAYITN